MYVKIAIRSLRKNKAHSFINITGLSVGMAVVMLIGLWIWDELSFNKYHKNYDRIAQVIQKEKFLGNIKVWERMPYRLVNELKTNYQNDFKHIVTAISTEGLSLSFDEKRISPQGLFISDGAPEMFTLKMLHGSWAGLKDPHSILLSASAAKSLFGNEYPINKTLIINDDWD